MSCEPYRNWMTDAAAGELQGSRRANLESHLNECAACRAECQRVQMIYEAIDLGVTAQTAAEPSPRLIEHVRQRIREDAPVALWWNARWIPAMACGAVLIVAASAWILWPRNDAGRKLIASSARPSSTLAERPAPVASVVEPKVMTERRGTIATLARPARKFSTRRIERQRPVPEIPEVIVQPGQMQAIMLLARAVNSGQVDGAKLLAELKAANQPIEVQPLEVKPLVIAPLETPKLSSDKSSEGAPDGGDKNFISSEETP
ncbi:MAG TPA: zf-HC2 domain-containing protein [Candidatus Acidoferrales bacterium]|nr:zf-HC2 domain-containing protein [Candidatus Acidoferrales bacterium]